ncbi:DUF6933 domain-containing protein [Paenibacillus dendritiformis]|uniref:DUF6933 domain-containing protein n=1 Tax=Paenibacillus dendritiformis TaxID=130049 RepID=UPI003CCF01FB
MPPLLSWHVNIYNLSKRKHIVFVNDLTRLSLIIDGLRTGQLERLKERFLQPCKTKSFEPLGRMAPLSLSR